MCEVCKLAQQFDANFPDEPTPTMMRHLREQDSTRLSLSNSHFLLTVSGESVIEVSGAINITPDEARRAILALEALKLHLVRNVFFSKEERASGDACGGAG